MIEYAVSEGLLVLGIFIQIIRIRTDASCHTHRGFRAVLPAEGNLVSHQNPIQFPRTLPSHAFFSSFLSHPSSLSLSSRSSISYLWDCSLDLREILKISSRTIRRRSALRSLLSFHSNLEALTSTLLLPHSFVEHLILTTDLFSGPPYPPGTCTPP